MGKKNIFNKNWIVIKRKIKKPLTLTINTKIKLNHRPNKKANTYKTSKT